MGDSLAMIPLSALKPSKRNVRKTRRSIDIESLAASIEAHGLLQNLTVRQNGGTDPILYEVVAGGRRLAAMKLLARRKRVEKDMPVPCRILPDGPDVDNELSLAENIIRVPVHPADQFEAFLKLQNGGITAEDIAARFGIATTVVLQRLKLAAVSPILMAAYRKDEMTLEQLTAFAISDDRNVQERVWADDPRKERPAHTIRRELTRSHVDADDRRAIFVGKEAYEAAGGMILRDLFDEEDEGYFTSVALLDELASRKLSAAAASLRSEGWRWVETRLEVDHEYLAQFGRLPPEIEEQTDEEKEQLEDLGNRYDELIADLGDDPPAEKLAELDMLEAEMVALSEPRERWNDEVKRDAGAYVAIDYGGELVIMRGLVSRKRVAAEKSKLKKSGRSAKGGIPDALRETLSGHRTRALRAELGRKPEVAFLALLYTLVLRTFFDPTHAACIDIRPANMDFRHLDVAPGESTAARAYAEDRATFSKLLPETHALWEWLSRRNFEDNLALLAHCIAGSVNALWRRGDCGENDRLTQAHVLSAAIGLDMTVWWQPTRVDYFDYVTKDAILSAVTEGVSKRAAGNIATMKKGPMAQRAEELLRGTGWLPEPLRAKEPAKTEAA